MSPQIQRGWQAFKARVSVQALLFGIGAAGVVLGIVGFNQEFPPREGRRAADVVDNVWRGLALIFLQSNAVERVDDRWPLVVARFLAPAATAGVLYGLTVRFLSESWNLVQLRRMHDHMVIIGLGVRGRAFAATSAGDVAALDVAAPVSLGTGRRPTIRWCIGDGRDTTALDRVGVRRARDVLILSGNDALNLEILEQVVAAARTAARTCGSG
jgi:hypothetical protein